LPALVLTLVAGSVPLPLWAAVSDPNFAGSPVPVGAGPRALGMGGAFSAVADDATANTWNPAGMTQLERPEIAASVGWYQRRVRQEDGGSDDRDDVDLDHISAVLPFHAFGCQQTIGLAWQRQFDFGRTVSVSSTSAPFGFTTIQQVDLEQEGSLASWSLSYAIEPLPGLSFGVTGHAWNDEWTGRSHYRKDIRESNTIPAFPATTVIDERREAEVVHGYSAVLGAWWQALPSITVALVLKPTYTLRFATDVDTVITDTFAPTVTLQERVQSRFEYPTSATLGLAWRHADRLTITCDATWTQWSHYRLLDQGRASSPVNSYVAPDQFSDGYSVRLGCEQLAIYDQMVLVGRLGALYEGLPGVAPAPSATQPDETRAVVDDWYGFTVGASLCFDHLLYDLGAQVRFGDDVGTGQDAPPDRTADITTVVVRLGMAYLF
jgi:long-subunit fatty acid transport protein